MNKLIDYIDFKIEQQLKHTKVNVVECLAFIKESLLPILDRANSLERERDALQLEVTALRQRAMELETLLADNAGAQMQLHSLESELTKLRNENEVLRAAKPMVALGTATSTKNRWN